MTDRLFVYGTLRFPEVMGAVAGSVPRSRPALIEGHACYLARHGRFPALVAATDDRTEGLLYHGVDAAMLQKLDAFESALFERRVMRVVSGGRERPAWTYLLVASQRRLLGRTRFDASRFAVEELPRWLVRLGLR